MCATADKTIISHKSVMNTRTSVWPHGTIHIVDYLRSLFFRKFRFHTVLWAISFLLFLYKVVIWILPMSIKLLRSAMCFLKSTGAYITEACQAIWIDKIKQPAYILSVMIVCMPVVCRGVLSSNCFLLSALLKINNIVPKKSWKFCVIFSEIILLKCWKFREIML